MSLSLLLFAGCGPPAPEPLPRIARADDGRLVVAAGQGLSQLYGTLVTDHGAVIVPNSAWRLHQASNHWFFVSAGTLVCHFAWRPTQPVRITLTPVTGSELRRLSAHWDGEDVSSAFARDHGQLTLTLAADRVAAGTHFLTLRAPRGPEGPQLFSRLSYQVEGQTYELGADEFWRWRYLSDLINFGVTGSNDREKLGGLVFVGPRQLSVELPHTDGGRFTARLQNSSHEPAVFHLRHAQGADVTVRLEPHQRHWLTTELPPTTAELQLVVEGSARGLFLWGAPNLIGAETASPPLILITLDTTRRDALSPYGGEPALTPNLGDFAAGATVYDHALTTSPWTLPSHASIFTGVYPSRHGAGVSSDHLTAGATTLAALLRRRGYLSAGFAGGTLTSYRFGLGRGFSVYRDADGLETRADALTTHVERFLAELPPQPLFLFVNYFDAHYPYLTPPADLARPAPTAESLPAPWPAVLSGDDEAWNRVVTGQVPAPVAAVTRLRDRYLGEVAFMDQQLGRLLAELERLELYDRALIVITADHGELLGERGFFSHSNRLDPELLEIPLLIKWPGRQDGRRVAELVSLVDLFSTLLNSGGVIDVRSEGLPLGAADGAALQARQVIFAEEHESSAHPLFEYMKLGRHAWAVAGRDFRQLLWEGDRAGSECYERRNGNWASVPCDLKTLLSASKLSAQLGYSNAEPIEGNIGLTDQDRAALKALGYL